MVNSGQVQQHTTAEFLHDSNIEALNNLICYTIKTVPYLKPTTSKRAQMYIQQYLHMSMQRSCLPKTLTQKVN